MDNGFVVLSEELRGPGDRPVMFEGPLAEAARHPEQRLSCGKSAGYGCARGYPRVTWVHGVYRLRAAVSSVQVVDKPVGIMA